MADKRCIIHLFRSRWGKALLAVACVVLAVAVALALRSGPGGEADVSSRLLQASEGLNRYELALRLVPEEHALAISETLTCRNDTGGPLDHLALRTWINAFRTEETSPAASEELYDACYPEGFSPGGLRLDDVMWNGERASYGYADEAMTALRIDIPPLAPGEEGTLFLRCVETIPCCAYRTGYVGNAYQLGNVIPLLSRWENGAWRQDPYTAVGDPFLSECANFTLTLRLPEEMGAPICTCPLTRDEDGVWQGEALAARDVALGIMPDANRATCRAGNTVIHSLAKTEAGAKRALEDARKALETYASLYGEYPYPSLTVCSADFPFGGMEYPGLIMIGESNYLDSRADTLELEVAHETAHQWFYALVGSDQVRDPWQDEAICEYAMLRYVKQRYGQGSFDTLKSFRVDAPMRESHLGALTPGSPIDYFSSLSDYAAVVYGRGAALMLALDEMLPGGVDAFLRVYAGTFAFQFATRQDFEALLNAYAAADLTPLITDYLDTAMQ